MDEERQAGLGDAANGSTSDPAPPSAPTEAKRAGGTTAADAASGHSKRGRRDETERLRRELQRATLEAASHLDDARRLKADFENYRKRAIKEQTAFIERASASLIERILPVLDNFELALIAADRTKDYDALIRGVELVYGELLDVLHKEGLSKIEADGKPFDPERHEAVMEAEGSAEGEPYVVDVLRTGYTLKGRVVRPSMVKVARR